MAEELGGEGLSAVAGDLSERDTCYREVEGAFAALGGLDVLVNNDCVFTERPVGGGRRGVLPLADGRQHELLLQPGGGAGAPGRPGSIVNVSPDSGLAGNRQMALH